jgi:aryl-alcohol dehydrogenase-like predicted oxidoreductase
MPFDQRILGKTGLRVGPLGVASSYGAPAPAFEEAFEKGCNYFYWGSRRTAEMGRAIKNICSCGKRDALVLVIQSYSRSAMLLEVSLKKALRSLALDCADILLLGWHNQLPAERFVEKALELKERGLCRFLALSSHNRSLFPQLARRGQFDLFHIRYNAAHRGAEEEVFPHLKNAPRPGTVVYTATRWGSLLQSKNMPPGEEALSACDCYRFALSNPAVDICLCGPKDVSQMREALRTLDLGALSEEQLGRMNRIGDYVREHGRKFF